MKSFRHHGHVCTIDGKNLIFDLEQRTPMDSDWGCAIEDYADSSVYAEHLRAHFPPGMVAEIEELLRAAGAFAPRVRAPRAQSKPLSSSVSIATGPRLPPVTRDAIETIARRIVGAFGGELAAGTWNDVEVEPYVRRCDSSVRVAGSASVTLGRTRTISDSALGGLREVGAVASIAVDLGPRGQITLSWPPFAVSGAAPLIAMLEAAGIIDGGALAPRAAESS